MPNFNEIALEKLGLIFNKIDNYNCEVVRNNTKTTLTYIDLLTISNYIDIHLLGREVQDKHKSDKVLNIVADVGMEYYPEEDKIFFIDHLSNSSFKATKEAIEQYIKGQEWSIKIAKEYLSNI